jgi:uncharacterized protein
MTRAALLALGLALALALPPRSAAQPSDTLPRLTQPVHDFAQVIDSQSAADLDRLIRALEGATRDTIVVVTIPTFRPHYADLREYAVRLFENHGRGIGQRGADAGALVVLAVEDREVYTEVGYGLEGVITDGIAGATSRERMVPYFRQGQYGQGLLAGVTRYVELIAAERNVRIEDLESLRHDPPPPPDNEWPIILVIVAFMAFARLLGGRGRRGRSRVRGGRSWSGWHGGGFTWGGGGFGGGGFGGGGLGGGGFGGFGGGGSGGGGGGARW